ncbi:hypothetical protein D3C87_1104900 [compost metagenome]
MQQVQSTEAPKLAIFCAGAFGITTGLRQPQNADTRITYIDTSEANLTSDIDAGKCYRIPMPPDADGRVVRGGGGQDRRRTAKAAMPHIAPILERFVPGAFNLLVFSCSGASGSVICSLLARQLSAADHSFLMVCVGETTTPKYLTNTRDTWKGLENMALSTKRPFVMSYHHNHAGVPQSAVDKDVDFVIEAVRALTCQFNKDLDASDIHNALNFNNVTSVPPQLATIAITDNRKAALAVMEPITTLSLFCNREEAGVVGTPHYSKIGYPQEPLISAFDQLHFVVNTISVDEINKQLRERDTEQKQAHGNYRSRAALVDVHGDNVTEEGLVIS